MRQYIDKQPTSLINGLCCLCFSDYLSISESLYKVLDSSNDNTVEKQVCEAVITELEEILNLSSHLDPTS